jgi:NAD+ kinase
VSERRAVLLIAHTGRPEAVKVGRELVERLQAAGIAVHTPAVDAERMDLDPVHALPEFEVPQHLAGTRAVLGTSHEFELVVVVGGDGTILDAAEYARPLKIPLLGINLGHVGFLAESEPDTLSATVQHIVDRSYAVEERLTVDVEVRHNDELIWSNWALNEVAVEKIDRRRMLELIVEIDGHPLSRYGCDAVVMATPTGSTAYAFSAGGPVVWPEVEALLLVPSSAHALFAKPIVVSPSSLLSVELAPMVRGADVTCDSRRTIEVHAGSRVEVRRGQAPVRFARLHATPFTSRLVAKFRLPVQGWRVRPATRGTGEASTGSARPGS